MTTMWSWPGLRQRPQSIKKTGAGHNTFQADIAAPRQFRYHETILWWSLKSAQVQDDFRAWLLRCQVLVSEREKEMKLKKTSEAKVQPYENVKTKTLIYRLGGH